MKVAFLGATRGMGRALARLMAERGDSLFLLGRNLPDLEKSARDLEVRPALREPMGVVLAPGHPLGRERSVAPAALSGLPLVLYEAGSNTRRVLDRFFEQEQVAARVAMETENVEIIKAMVAGGLGVSVIPYAACAREVKAGRLLYRPIRGRQLLRETGWVWLKTDHPSRAVAELIRVFDDLRDRFPGRPPKPEA